MADREDLEDFRQVAANIADRIENDIIDTDLVTERKRWYVLAQVAKDQLSLLMKLVDDEVDKMGQEKGKGGEG